MEQKIIQIGNSTGIIIPKSLLDKLGLKPGNPVIIEDDSYEEALIISKKGSKRKKTTITPRFIDILDRVNQQYAIALKELAQK